MEVDYNNLRKQIAYSLDRVIKTLNDGIMPENEYVSHRTKHDTINHFEGDVLVSTKDLQKHINSLRTNVWVLLCCMEEGNPDNQPVFQEVIDSGGLANFNNIDDE